MTSRPGFLMRSHKWSETGDNDSNEGQWVFDFLCLCLEREKDSCCVTQAGYYCTLKCSPVLIDFFFLRSSIGGATYVTVVDSSTIWAATFRDMNVSV